MRKTSILLMIVTVLTKIFGLAREKTLAHFFGASAMADIFLVAFSIPMVITNLMTGAIGTGFIPIYDRIRTEKGRPRADLFTANLANVLAVIFAVVSLLGILGAKPLVRAMSPGFDEGSFHTAVYITRIVMVSVLVTSVASVFRAYLQIYKHFAVSVSHAIIMNLILMGAMAAGKMISIRAMAWGMLFAFVFQYVIFIPFVKKEGYRHAVLLDWEDPHLRQMLSMILPIFISTSVIELNYIINKALASGIATGGISAMNYSSRLIDFVTGIVITSIVTVTYPRMARAASEGNKEELQLVTGESVSLMTVLVIPAALGLMTFAPQIVRLLFYGGAFGEEDVAVTGSILFFYAIGVLGIGLRELQTRVYYAIGDMKTPVINSVIMVAVNVILSLILRQPLGLKGLSLATSLSLFVGAILLMINLIGKHRIHPLKGRLVNIGKITVSAVIMAVVGKMLYPVLEQSVHGNLALLGTILVAVILYGLLIIILRVDETTEALQYIKNKMK